MKKPKQLLTILLLIFFVSSNYFAQDDGIVYTGKLGTEIENQFPDSKIVDVSELARLDDELKQAIELGNIHQEQILRNRIYELTKDNISIPNFEDRDYPVIESSDPASPDDWLFNDVLIYDGDIGQVGSDHRRTDLKMGEDGNLYAALIRKPETSQTGRADVFKSTDGGSSWTFVSGVTSTAYIGQISITVEVRSAGNGNLDSTRIFLFYSRSPNSNFDDATINYVSFKRDGSGWKGGTSVLTPSTGNKLLYPCAVSDGQYFTTATYIGVTCGEYSNSGTEGINLHLARTTNWGDSYTTAAINDGYPTWGDWFPVSAFKNSTIDSVYIAVERRFASILSQPRVIATPWSPSAGFKRYSISVGSSDEYKKPAITIVQDASTLDKKIIVAIIKNGQAVYSYSNDGGVNWNLDFTFSLSTETNITYVALSSDSNKAGGGYVIGAFQKSTSDTIVIRRGIPGSLGTRIIQPNEFQSSTFNSPNVAIYNDGGNKYSALSYTGLSTGNYTSNLYFDGENLITDVGGLPVTVEAYALEQNYPNPFNPSTIIRFSIPEQTNATLKIFNSIGQEVASLFNGEVSAGNHEVNFNASALSSGVYFYRIQTPSFTDTKKMILIK
jgi:hypothetical protein